MRIELEDKYLAYCFIKPETISNSPLLPRHFFQSEASETWNKLQLWSKAKKPIHESDFIVAHPELRTYIERLESIANIIHPEVYEVKIIENSQRYAIRTKLEALWREVDTWTVPEITKEINSLTRVLDEDVPTGYNHVQAFAKEFTKKLEIAYKRKTAFVGVPCGIEEIDKLTLGFDKGEMVVIGARPGTGKTAIILNFMRYQLRHGYKVGVFSAEMSGASLVSRKVSADSMVESSRIRTGFLSQGDLSKVTNATMELANYPLFINDQPGISLSRLQSDARKMKRTENVDIIYVDYLGLIKSDNPKKDRFQQVAEISSELKNLARELEIPIVVLSQLNREAQDKKPSLANLRESGAVEQDADMVAFLTPAGDDQGDIRPIDFILAKNRSGSVGTVHLAFHTAVQRFAHREESTDDRRAGT